MTAQIFRGQNPDFQNIGIYVKISRSVEQFKLEIFKDICFIIFRSSRFLGQKSCFSRTVLTSFKWFFSDDIAVGVNVMTEAQSIGASDSVIVEHYREENLSLVTSVVVKELFLVQINQNSH